MQELFKHLITFFQETEFSRFGDTFTDDFIEIYLTEDEATSVVYVEAHNVEVTAFLIAKISITGASEQQVHSVLSLITPVKEKE